MRDVGAGNLFAGGRPGSDDVQSAVARVQLEVAGFGGALGCAELDVIAGHRARVGADRDRPEPPLRVGGGCAGVRWRGEREGGFVCAVTGGPEERR